MIKKYLFGIGIFLLSFISFSYGFDLSQDMYVRQNGVIGFSPYSSSYDIAGLSKGGLITQSLGVGKNLFYLSDGSYFSWVYHSNYGTIVPYISVHSGSDYVQGVPLKYAICDSFSGQHIADYDLQNCTVNNFNSGSLNGIISLLNSVTSDDYFAFSLKNQKYDNYRISIGLLYCISSNSLGKSLCFGISDNNYSNRIYPGYVTQGNNTGSLNYPTDWDSISRDILSDSPAYVGSNTGVNQGSIEGIINNQITGDYVYADCSWKDVLIALESEGYNKYICYGGLDNFDLYDSSVNYNPIAGQGLSISQIWAWSGSRAWDNFPEWFTFWNGLYKDITDNNYNAMWESYPAVYRTYFQVYNAYKGSVLDPRTVLEYCQLRTLTGDQLNNSAGGYFKPVCETIIREKQTGLWQSRLDGSIYSGGIYTGDVPIGVNWNGVGNMSGVTAQSDGLNFIQNFFNLAKSNLLTNYSGSPFGILPSYIVIFMIALILFRFISH